MKVKFFLCAAIACGALCAFAAKDPVLMTINGKDVTLSEFEYLYKKNSSQQVEKESLAKYVERFVIRKESLLDVIRICYGLPSVSSCYVHSLTRLGCSPLMALSFSASLCNQALHI